MEWTCVRSHSTLTRTTFKLSHPSLSKMRKPAALLYSYQNLLQTFAICERNLLGHLIIPARGVREQPLENNNWPYQAEKQVSTLGEGDTPNHLVKAPMPRRCLKVPLPELVAIAVYPIQGLRPHQNQTCSLKQNTVLKSAACNNRC